MTMRKLKIPDRLKEEFETVELIWKSGAKTRRTDCLLLAWVKYEKQLRRLFSYLVFQHPAITRETVSQVINVMAKDSNLKPKTLLAGIEEFGGPSLDQLLNEANAEWGPKIEEIREVRNKLMHGQLTGRNVSSPQMEHYVCTLVAWVDLLAFAFDNKIGYDGLQRKTFSQAKATKGNHLVQHRFSTIAEFAAWLPQFTAKAARRR